MENVLMIAPTLELTTERTSPWSRVISVSGELDRMGAPRLRRALGEQMADDRVRQLIVDLSDVEFMDGGGLRLLLETSEAMRASGRRFCVVCTNQHVLRLFTLIDARGRLQVVRSRSALQDAIA
ncbi:MAG: STAS domain-containing protein [Thermoleophilaceae bacterium]